MTRKNLVTSQRCKTEVQLKISKSERSFYRSLLQRWVILRLLCLFLPTRREAAGAAAAVPTQRCLPFQPPAACADGGSVF